MIRFAPTSRCTEEAGFNIAPAVTEKGNPGLRIVRFQCEPESNLVVHPIRQEDGALVTLYFGQQIRRCGHHAERIDRCALISLFCLSWKGPPDCNCNNYCDSDAVLTRTKRFGALSVRSIHANYWTHRQ